MNDEVAKALAILTDAAVECLGIVPRDAQDRLAFTFQCLPEPVKESAAFEFLRCAAEMTKWATLMWGKPEKEALAVMTAAIDTMPKDIADAVKACCVEVVEKMPPKEIEPGDDLFGFGGRVIP